MRTRARVTLHAHRCAYAPDHGAGGCVQLLEGGGWEGCGQGVRVEVVLALAHQRCAALPAGRAGQVQAVSVCVCVWVCV
jgi:hypothetical protein